MSIPSCSGNAIPLETDDCECSPMASAFSICALVVPWRQEIPPGKTEAEGVKLQDPKW